MGSVMSHENCPKCKGKETLFSDYYYKQGIDYGYCNKCGFSYKSSPESTKTSGGFGAYRTKGNKGFNRLGSFNNARSIPKTIQKLSVQFSKGRIAGFECTQLKNRRLLTTKVGGDAKRWVRKHRSYNYSTSSIPF